MGDNFEDVLLDGMASDEEFDEFVSELLHVEPPPLLVHAILSSVARIPLPEIQLESLEQAGDATKDAARFA